LYVSLDHMQLSEFDRLFTATFHSISAYCNAGFSNLPDGFQSSIISSSTLILVIVMILIIAGGIGFYTITDLFGMKTNLLVRKKGLSLQTKIIVYSSLCLIILGAIFIWLLEIPQWSNLPAKQQILNAVFTSVTSRTAGFSIVDIHGMLIPALLFVVFLMYIGGAPNSTSGGIKITTALILMAGFWAFVRGKDRVEIGWNTINMLIIRRAFIVFILSIILLFVSLLLLTITESFSFFDLFFETVSAFGTVGLSRGITPDLSIWGKIIIIIVMFLGRIGLFTVAIALGEEISQVKYRYPETTIIVG
jgi:trk system potassium uptake protein TrkH